MTPGGGTPRLQWALLRKAAHQACGGKSGISADCGDLHHLSTCSLAFNADSITVALSVSVRAQHVLYAGRRGEAETHRWSEGFITSSVT